jgi:transcriptional regulator with XRE-family HTH domain/tetratricopeptide (TPR) repeat protein
MVWRLTLDSHSESVLANFADLLTGSASRRALAQRDIAAVYRMLRDAGISQASIAQATGQKQSEVSEIISGRQVQSVVLLARIADGLGVPRGWMGLAYEPDSTPVQQDPQTGDLSDANLLRHAVTVLQGRPVLGPADPIRVRTSPTPVPRRAGPADIAQVAATTQRLGQLARDLGGVPMSSALTAHTQTSEALLSASMGEPVRGQLLAALSDAHRAAGCAAADAGLRELAQQHHVRSMDCAGEAGDMLRAVVALDELGWLELGIGQPNEALKLFQLGAAAASSAVARFRLEYHCAYALALLGVANEAIAALRRADDSYQTASNELPPWDDFAAAISHVEGCTYFALGRFIRAAGALSAAMDGASHTVGCTVSNSGLLAAAQLRSGELGSGLRTAQRVVRLAKGLRSVWIRHSLAPLQEAAAARRDSACQDLAREVALLRSAA